jgi:hypothetical protein
LRGRTTFAGPADADAATQCQRPLPLASAWRKSFLVHRRPPRAIMSAALRLSHGAMVRTRTLRRPQRTRRHRALQRRSLRDESPRGSFAPCVPLHDNSVISDALTPSPSVGATMNPPDDLPGSISHGTARVSECWARSSHIITILGTSTTAVESLTRKSVRVMGHDRV